MTFDAYEIAPNVEKVTDEVLRETGCMSDPSGDAPELLWPARLIRPAARTVYLDLNHWIALAKAATDHRDGAQYRDTLAACREASQAGVVFPISSVSYIEVSKIKDPRQRAHLAQVIEELSGFQTILSHPLIVTMELDAAISDALGVPSPDEQVLAYLGWGVGYAFGVLTTPTISGPLDDERTSQAAPRPGGYLHDLMVDSERFVLRGPEDDEAADMRLGGWDPAAGWKIACERAEEERAQVARFEALHSTAHKKWRQGRLRDALTVRELTQSIWDLFGETLSRYGPGVTIEQLLGDRSQARRFVRQMPSSEVAIELKTALHRDASRAADWLPNDVTDIDQLAMTMPYCDVVVTEKAAADALKKAHLDERCATTLLRSLNDLSTFL